MSDGGVASRRLAIEAIERIDRDDAYANLLLGPMLERSDLDARDRGFVTELVYGSTRRRRALDFAIDRFVSRADVEPRVRAALRVGAYQILELGTPVHAAVDATVAATPKRARGFVNAILRRIADHPLEYPTEAIGLSYPDWLVERFLADLDDRAIPVLTAMNRAASVHVRADGYRQDPASTAVAELVPAGREEVVVDLCAAPGGKATHIARHGATVIGVDRHRHRAGLIVDASALTGAPVPVLVADGVAAPILDGAASAVLVDAPCSGLGSLRRRPDARWRVQPEDVGRLAELQRGLLDEATRVLCPGGTLVFSVCTLTRAESTEIDEWLEQSHPELQPQPLPAPWEPFGRGGRLLPDRFDGDGMTAYVYRKT